MSEQMRNVEPHARLSGNKIIYPNSMNREDLSKMSKDELINMLLGKQTVSANKTGPVQTASAKRAGPVLNPKSLTQLAAKKNGTINKATGQTVKQNAISYTISSTSIS